MKAAARRSSDRIALPPRARRGSAAVVLARAFDWGILE